MRSGSTNQRWPQASTACAHSVLKHGQPPGQQSSLPFMRKCRLPMPHKLASMVNDCFTPHSRWTVARAVDCLEGCICHHSATKPGSAMQAPGSAADTGLETAATDFVSASTDTSQEARSSGAWGHRKESTARRAHLEHTRRVHEERTHLRHHHRQHARRGVLDAVHEHARLARLQTGSHSPTHGEVRARVGVSE